MKLQSLRRFIGGLRPVRESWKPWYIRLSFRRKILKTWRFLMKHYLKPVLALATFAILAASSVQADTEEKMIIALKTDDFELTETDISALAVGEGKTIETESGKVIDILRTTDGVEIYVDGELLEMNFDHDSLHEEHMVRKHVEVICDGDEECDEMVWISDAEHIDLEELHEMHKGEEGHKIIVIRKEIITED
jgi:hypothetical protein